MDRATRAPQGQFSQDTIDLADAINELVQQMSSGTADLQSDVYSGRMSMQVIRYLKDDARKLQELLDALWNSVR